ncbi:MAG: fluoride efflux transporter CrcB [Chthoniobacterales bacterium]
MLKTYLAVMLGGALGTGLRLALSTWLANRYGETFPIGTLVVNISGCFLIGVFAALTGSDGPLLTSPLVRIFVMIGILGGFTTFSSFSLQTLSLWQDGEWLRGGLNALFSLAFCLIAVWLGQVTANLLTHR